MADAGLAHEAFTVRLGPRAVRSRVLTHGDCRARPQAFVLLLPGLVSRGDVKIMWETPGEMDNMDIYMEMLPINNSYQISVILIKHLMLTYTKIE